MNTQPTFWLNVATCILGGAASFMILSGHPVAAHASALAIVLPVVRAAYALAQPYLPKISV